LKILCHLETAQDLFGAAFGQVGSMTEAGGFIETGLHAAKTGKHDTE